MSKPTLDEPVAIHDSKMGVTLSEQEAPVVATRVEGRVDTGDKRAASLNPDMAWTLEGMLKRFNLFDTFDFTPTNVVGTAMKTYDVLTDLLENQIAVTPFMRFIHFRCTKVSVRVEIIGNRFCQGRVWVVWFPSCMPKSNLKPGYVPSMMSLSTLTHVSLDPNQGTVATLDIPFVFNKEYMDLTNGDALGQIFVVPAATFIPGETGAPNAKIKAYVSIEGAEFKQPRPGVLSMRKILNGEQREYEGANGSMRRDFVAHSGIVNSLLDAGVKGVEDVVKNITPANLIGDALGLLDKPQITMNPEPLVLKEQQYMGNVANMDYAEYLSAYPDAQQVTDTETFGTGVDEMSLDELLKKKATLVATFQWTTAMDVGTVLYATDVGPMASFPISKNPTTGTPVSLFDNVSSKFCFWAGGIKYIVEIVGTAFHEGKLDLNYHPTLSKATTTLFSAANSVTQYSMSHFLRNANNMFGVTCPYLGDTPFKKVWRGQTLTDTYTANAPQLRFTDYFSGSFDIRVAARLNAPTTVSGSVTGLVYQMAADDYELAMNTLTGGSLQFVAEVATRGDMVAHAGQSEGVPDRNRPFSEFATVDLCAGQGMWSEGEHSHFNEKFKTLRDLAKKSQRAYRAFQNFNIADLTDLQLQGRDPLLFYAPIMYFSSLGGTPRHSNYISWLATLFRLYRGAMTFKVRVTATLIGIGPSRPPTTPLKCRMYITPSESQPLTIFDGNSVDLFPSDQTDLTTAQPISMGYASDVQVAEIKVPFMTNRTAYINRHPYDVDTTGFLTENYSHQKLIQAVYIEGLPAKADIPSNYTVRLMVEVVESFSDESTMGLYTGFPNMYIQNSSASATTAMGPDQWTLPA